MARIRIRKEHKRRISQFKGEIMVELQEMKSWRGRWNECFANDWPLWLEIGCGRGAFLSQLRVRNPRVNLIGMELKPDRCVTARNKLVQSGGETPFRILQGFAETLSCIFAAGELERIYLNFPDPWPTEPNRRKRLFGAQFLPRYQCMLKPGGELHFKTDDGAAWQEFMAHLPQSFCILEAGEDLDQSSLAHIKYPTEFETLFRNKGQQIYFASLRRDQILGHATKWTEEENA